MRFLYQGSDDVAAGIAFYTALGARVAWDVTSEGVRVAAVDHGGPLLLLASHRPAGSAIAVFEVADLDGVVAGLRQAGYEALGEPFEIPNGPCRLLRVPGGGEVALFEDVRPWAFRDLPGA